MNSKQDKWECEDSPAGGTRIRVRNNTDGYRMLLMNRNTGGVVPHFWKRPGDMTKMFCNGDIGINTTETTEGEDRR